MVCRPIGSGAQDQIACHTANFPSRSLELALELAYQYVIAGVALWRRAYTPSAISFNVLAVLTCVSSSGVDFHCAWIHFSSADVRNSHHSFALRVFDADAF